MYFTRKPDAVKFQCSIIWRGRETNIIDLYIQPVRLPPHVSYDSPRWADMSPAFPLPGYRLVDDREGYVVGLTGYEVDKVNRLIMDAWEADQARMREVREVTA